MLLTTARLCSLLREIPKIHVTQEGDKVLVHVPAIDRSILLDANAVTRHSWEAGPNGVRALMLWLDVAGVVVIVASTDLVFAPDTLDSGLGININVKNAPPLVSFSEMMRDLGAAEGNSATETNFAKVMGTLVMLRYFIAGAKRLGIECGDAESKLERLWERTGLSSIARERSEHARPSVDSRSRTRQRRGRQPRRRKDNE